MSEENEWNRGVSCEVKLGPMECISIRQMNAQ